MLDPIVGSFASDSRPVLLEAWSRPLLVVHAILGFGAAFAVAHHAAFAWQAARGGGATRQLRRFGWIAPAVLLLQGAVGLVLYPAYRVHVRFARLDVSAPGVAQLFELKEHLAALSFALVVAAALAGRSIPAERGSRRAVAALSSAGALLVWTATLIGVYVTARHPVGLP
jgi:hypothetical protein